MRQWIVPLVLFAILVTGASRMHDLWGDEAETALFARNVLKYGKLQGWDGTNIMGIGNASVLNSDLVNHSSPPLQYYLVAASFALFGESAVSARLPFIVLSLFAIPLIWYVAKEITGDLQVANFSAILLAFNVQWILFAYQARYYSVTVVAGLLLVLSAMRLTKWKWSLVLVASGIIFFYANYVSFGAWAAAVFFVLARKKNILRMLATFACIALVTLPWFVYQEPIANRGTIALFSWRESALLFWRYLLEGLRAFHIGNVLPIGMVAIIAATAITIKAKGNDARGLLPLILIGIIYMMFMASFTTIAFVDTVFVHARYTTVMIPVLLIIAAWALAHLRRWNRWAAGVLLFCFLCTNLLTFTRPGSYLVELVGEMLHPYPTPARQIATYLKANAKKGDSAFVSLDRDHEPLLFFLGDHIRFVNRVSFINSRIFPKNRGVIPRYIYDFRDNPDWVILMGRRGADGTFLTFDFRSLDPSIDLARDYEEIVIPVFFSDLSRPELERHAFAAPTVSAEDFVYLYRRKTQPNDTK